MQRQLEVLKTAMLKELDASCAQFLEQSNERLAALQTCRQELQGSENLKEDITKELLEGDRVSWDRLEMFGMIRRKYGSQPEPCIFGACNSLCTDGYSRL